MLIVSVCCRGRGRLWLVWGIEMADDAMWCLVMFDLPVATKRPRREATRFRNDLLDWGFCMVQFSVYVKYWPTGGQDHTTLRAIKSHLPEGGQVRVLALTDRQWATGLRFDNARPRKEAGTPEQLMIF